VGRFCWQCIAHKVHVATLLAGVEHLGHAVVGVGDEELDTAQAAAGELAQERRRPERSASGEPTFMPSSCRRIAGDRRKTRPPATAPFEADGPGGFALPGSHHWGHDRLRLLAHLILA
jgi:hypothetical protein